MAGKLPVKSGKDTLKTFYRAKRRGSFDISFKRRGKGDHVVLHNKLCRNFSVPLHRELKPGTLLSVISDACMTKDEFLEYDP